MKLGKIIKHLDSMAKVTYVSYDKEKDEEEVLWQGLIDDTPYYLTRFTLDTDELSEAITINNKEFYIYLQ
jgi:hypothetical protein